MRAAIQDILGLHRGGHHASREPGDRRRSFSQAAGYGQGNSSSLATRAAARDSGAGTRRLPVRAPRPSWLAARSSQRRIARAWMRSARGLGGGQRGACLVRHSQSRGQKAPSRRSIALLGVDWQAISGSSWADLRSKVPAAGAHDGSGSRRAVIGRAAATRRRGDVGAEVLRGSTSCHDGLGATPQCSRWLK